MSWRERMGPASFRGVPFFVDTSERAGGRRGVTHEYPGRSEPYREDLGRATREFTVEGFVLGEEYLVARDALLAALEAAGAGELVHPYYGTLRVAVLGYRVRESSQDGGMARVSVEVVETPAAPSQPTAVVDTGSAVRSSVATARTEVEAEFTAAYSPGVRTEAMAAALDSASVAMEEVVESANLETQELALLRNRLDRLRAAATSLVRLPEALLTQVGALVGLLPSGVLGAYGFDPGTPPPATTSNRVLEAANAVVLQQLLQRLLVLRAAELALVEEYESYEAAIAAREEITELVDEQAESAGDELFPALVQLRADLVRAVPGDTSDLPRLLSYTPPAVVPALVLAYQLYGDVALEEDIVQRNNVSHPGFLRAGQALEVLSRG